MQPIGPKLAEGRDSEIFEHGRDKVLRVARDGRSLIAEADIMRYVRSHGYPCPECCTGKCVGRVTRVGTSSAG